jgi:RHS repeat-associated protein
MTSDLSAFFNLGFSSNDYIDGDRLNRWSINFKGRIYDSVLNRFLNPDPFIQEPYNIQNLNRYSYGLNNPFKYNDPSGIFLRSYGKQLQIHALYLLS